MLLLDKARRLLHKIEVDRAVFFGISSRIWGVFAGPLTALLIVLKFTPEYQGYYYTFGSLLALQVFVELGLATVIIQFASHEWSKLKLDENGGISGDQEALSRLVSLANITSKWYLMGSALIVLGLGVGGYIFFSRSHDFNVNWVLPWFSLCFFTGITICFSPVWALLEGCNQVASVYTYRFFQGIISSLFIWIAIFSGAKLWAPSISVAVIVFCAILFFRFKYRNFIKTLFFTRPLHSCMNWRTEILPMQWRIAVSWISGYFAFSLFTPVIFNYHGPVVAGQFGMTWSAVGMISMITSSWLSPKVPQFGMLIAKKEYVELDKLFWRVTKISWIVTVLVAMAGWIIIYLLNILRFHFAVRLLPLLPTTIFIIAQVIMMFTVPFSVYLRAHKKEPLIYISVLIGALVALSTFVLGKYYSVTAIGLGYLAINILILPFIVLIWQRCRVEWHARLSMGGAAK